MELKLSTRGEYGLRAMFDLAQRYGEGPISLKSVAERQDISEHYLEQLFASLRKAGLVRSVRGAQGGYTLAREPREIKVGEIIRVLEGPIAPMDCVSEEEGEGTCARAETCVARTIWEKVRDSIAGVLDSITLEDMVAEAHRLQPKDKYMYYI
ncbi:transcriptional regulator, BadM/Rrf2 family [Thermanaeromonas toyohensis ToBE]|uniref:Transcriptional regulator, BadM/Rrf2 family n=1 Tax=Thermanaeromonas toyohensis ToBE TaxID=698762 RepID=A0A1W1VZN3_9FIRM|nr:transcriptional regulator, BadM/Rrf2 family [Thermanaeromonas toyohensis ToBE]